MWGFLFVFWGGIFCVVVVCIVLYFFLFGGGRGVGVVFCFWVASCVCVWEGVFKGKVFFCFINLSCLIQKLTNNSKTVSAQFIKMTISILTRIKIF